MSCSSLALNIPLAQLVLVHVERRIVQQEFGFTSKAALDNDAWILRAEEHSQNLQFLAYWSRLSFD